MKKHIKKKFLNQVQLTDEVQKILDESNKGIPVSEISKIKSIPKEYTGILITDMGIAFQAFQYKYQGQNRFIPEPDPVLVYFHSAYLNYRLIDEKKNVILKNLLTSNVGEPMINELYEYFGLTSGFVIFLFTALEAFMNRCIPKDFVYIKPEKKYTITYDKRQIEEYLSFDEKIKTVLPKAKEKNFIKQFPLKWNHIVNLKEFRDSIVHTKASKEGSSPYDYIYKKALDFKYEESINAVKDFCNYYHELNYITECDCNKDW